MATEPVPDASTSEDALRERIHRLFCGDAPAPPPVAPPFWVGPTEEQKSMSFLDIEERLELSDDIDVGADASSVEQRWMDSPRVDLDGMSPEAMLTRDEPSRRRLCAYVAAIEAAVRQGSFS